MNAEAPSEPLALPPPDPSSTENAKSLSVNQIIKLDELGPMVVNSDGTLSRISNWKSLTKEEQERTMRVLGARNKLRIENEKKNLQPDFADGVEGVTARESTGTA